MGLIYKVIISLVAIVHIIGFAMGVFMPEAMFAEFGVEFAENLVPISIHFGLLLGIFASFLSLAAFWAFKGKPEGFTLGIVAGVGMTVAFIFDLIMVEANADYVVLVMGLLTALTAYMAQKAHNSSSGAPA